jgi:hypothetical protein
MLCAGYSSGLMPVVTFFANLGLANIAVLQYKERLPMLR